MKKLLLLIAIISLAACTDTQPPPQEEFPPTITDNNGNEVTTYSISDFFPFEENVSFVVGNENFPNSIYETFTTHVNGNRIQQSITADQIAHTVVFEHDGNTLRQIFSFTDYPIFEDITRIEPSQSWVVLQEPLIIGNSWQTDDESNGTSIITAAGFTMETPAGTFTETLEVTTEFPNGDISVTTFAVGVGMIHDSWNVDFAGVTTSGYDHLLAVNNSPRIVEILVFQPDDQLMGLDSHNAEFPVNTNQNFPELFTQLLRQEVSFFEGIIVNQITVDRVRNVVSVDFSRNYLEINMGVSLEMYLLNSLANTFGNFYKVGNFRITLDGENYESGHMLFGDDDIIPVVLN